MKKFFPSILFNIGILATTSCLAIPTGEEIYNNHCSACHMQGVAGAPKVHNQDVWQKLYAAAEAKAKQTDPSLSGEKLKEKTLSILMGSVKKGLNAMPAGGMCPTCTD